MNCRYCRREPLAPHSKSRCVGCLEKQRSYCYRTRTINRLGIGCVDCGGEVQGLAYRCPTHQKRNNQQSYQSRSRNRQEQKEKQSVTTQS